jgi:hypothetical protein
MWCFSPGLIALGLSYELTLRLWTFIEHSPRPRKFESWTSSTAGFDTLRALRILVLTLGIPGLIVTLLALPIHTCITNTGLSIGHFAHITMVEHPYSDVRNITVTLGIRLRNGSLERWPAIVLDFQDGTRWSSGDNRDPEPAINEQLLQFLVAKTGLTPRYIDAFPFGKA